MGLSAGKKSYKSRTDKLTLATYYHQDMQHQFYSCYHSTEQLDDWKTVSEWVKYKRSNSQYLSVNEFHQLHNFHIQVYVCVCVLSCVWLFVTPKDCSPPGSSAHGISQARILEWVAISFSRGSFWPRDWTCHLLQLPQWQADSLPLSHSRSNASIRAVKI